MMNSQKPSAQSGKSGQGLNLVVDIGNTNTVIGFFRNGKIVSNWRLATRRETTEDEVVWWIHSLLLPAKVKRSLNGLAMTSVVPALDGVWARALNKAFGLTPEILDYSNCGGLRLEYSIPSQIGGDRLANVLGAWSLGIEAGVVLDFGTATTFDVFSDYTYWGGIICPGVQSSLQGLAQSASKISEVELRWPETVVGKTTESALRTGILQGTVGQVEYLLKRVFAEKKMKNPVVISTGGLATLVQGHAPSIQRVEPDLTLMGLNFLLSRKLKQTKGKR